MGPTRPIRDRGRSNRGYAEYDILEGIPVRQWTRQTTTVGATPRPEVPPARTMQPELPMPKDAHLLSPMSYALLKAARAGRVQRPSPTDSESKENADGEAEEIEDRGFQIKKWALVPRENENPDEFNYLAERRKGLVSALKREAPQATRIDMRRLKVRRIDNAGNSYITEEMRAPGETVEGEILEETLVKSTTSFGGLADGLEGVSGAVDGAIVMTPDRRRPPPPRKKGKGARKGRKKKVQFAPGDDIAQNSGGASKGVDISITDAVGPDGQIQPAVTEGPVADIEMGEGDEEDEGDEGEDDDEDDEGEDGEEVDGDAEHDHDTPVATSEAHKTVPASHTTEEELRAAASSSLSEVAPRENIDDVAMGEIESTTQRGLSSSDLTLTPSAPVPDLMTTQSDGTILAENFAPPMISTAPDSMQPILPGLQQLAGERPEPYQIVEASVPQALDPAQHHGPASLVISPPAAWVPTGPFTQAAPLPPIAAFAPPNNMAESSDVPPPIDAILPPMSNLPTQQLSGGADFPPISAPLIDAPAIDSLLAPIPPPQAPLLESSIPVPPLSSLAPLIAEDVSTLPPPNPPTIPAGPLPPIANGLVSTSTELNATDLDQSPPSLPPIIAGPSGIATQTATAVASLPEIEDQPPLVATEPSISAKAANSPPKPEEAALAPPTPTPALEHKIDGGPAEVVHGDAEIPSHKSSIPGLGLAPPTAAPQPPRES
ncbi:MAG: LYR motif-containing protein 4 [Vezdaea aestivalis]|nr:MAG: LYR motif-containing protein 4 [Vezdaea aestivalis]